MVKWCLIATDDDFEKYYTGKKYIYQGKPYAVLSLNKDDAKIYSSGRHAYRSADMLKFENCSLKADFFI
ncbi:MAG: hypothetical protein Q4P17_07645 [Methanobacterium sp.]|nr:hypothetical protein [Methanobacterium sp.]